MLLCGDYNQAHRFYHLMLCEALCCNAWQAQLATDIGNLLKWAPLNRAVNPYINQTPQRENTMKSALSAMVITSAVLLAACESKWNKMSDDEIAGKSSECAAIADPSSAMIQVCKNVERECERRRSNGIYVC